MKNKIIVYLYLVFNLSGISLLSAQSFNFTIGGEGGDNTNAVVESNEGGYIIVGSTFSGMPYIEDELNGDLDIWLIKINNEGKKVWSRYIGGNKADYASAMIKTHDNHYLITGYSYSNNSGDFQHTNGGHSDMWIIKFDEDGQIIWDTTISSEKSLIPNEIFMKKDGGFTFTGSVANVPPGPNQFINYSWLGELNESGILVWDTIFREGEHDHQYIFYQTSDNNYISTGNLSTGTTRKRYNKIIQLDENKKLIKDVFIGVGRESNGYSKPTSDGGCIMLSSSSSSSLDSTAYSVSGGRNLLITKLSNEVEIEKYRILGGENVEIPINIEILTDGYILLGVSGSSNNRDVTSISNGEVDAWAVRLDTTLNIVWERLIGGAEYDYLVDIEQTNDGGFIAVGGTNSSNTGDILSENQGGLDAWIIKIDKDGNFDTRVSNLDLPLAPAYQIYPNPFKDELQIELHLPQTSTISLAVYDASGKLIHTLAEGKYTQGKHCFNWKNTADLNRLAVGNYWLTFTDKDHRLSGFSTVIQKH